MITVLAEKPDVGIKIAAALGGIKTADGFISFEQLNTKKRQVQSESVKGYLETTFNGNPCTVTWGLGHLCELYQAQDYNPSYRNWRVLPIPFIPEQYKIKPNSKKAITQLKLIKSLFAKSDYIINATDFDREGEVIFSYIYEYTKCKKPVKRVCYSSMTKNGFQKAFSHLLNGSDMKNTEAAGRMRSIADWVVGANLTAAMTVKHPGSGILSIGRVQTPTLRILVDRELEIRNFVPTPYYTISAVFTTCHKTSYRASHTTEKFMTLDELQMEMTHLEQNRDKGIVLEIKKTIVKKWMPHLYNLSGLQMEANSKYNMTLKQTLDTAQSLYSKGLTTYPRTTSQYLPEDMGPSIVKVINILKQNPEYSDLIQDRPVPTHSKYWYDNSKVDSHFAIVPTGAVPKGLSAAEAKIYDLICRSVIRMLYGPAEIEETRVMTDVDGSLFKTVMSKILDPGWYAVDGRPKLTEPVELKEKERVIGEFQSIATETQPPKRYSDKTLLGAMISAGKFLDDKTLSSILDDPDVGGIGTSATRDSIIETLIQRKYIVREKKVFHATDKGIDLIRSFPVDVVKSPEMTAVWEKRLNGIASGTENADQFKSDIEKELTFWCDKVKEAPAGCIQSESKIELNCPICGTKLKKKSWGYACSGCSFTLGTIAGKKLTADQMEALLTKGKTGKISGFRSKAGKPFSAILIWNKEKKSIDFFFPKKKGT